MREYVCAYVHMYVCMYHVYVATYTYMFTHIHTYTHTYVYIDLDSGLPYGLRVPTGRLRFPLDDCSTGIRLGCASLLPGSQQSKRTPQAGSWDLLETQGDSTNYQYCVVRYTCIIQL